MDMEKAPSFQEFLKLLEGNGRETKEQDLSLMAWYLDGMERQFDAVLQERAAEKLGKRLEKKHSIRRDLVEKREKVNAVAASPPDRVHKPSEAAL